MDELKEEEYTNANDIREIDMSTLTDIRDISIEEEWSRNERIEHLKNVSKNGFVKYDNILIKLEFKSVFPEDFLEGISE